MSSRGNSVVVYLALGERALAWYLEASRGQAIHLHRDGALKRLQGNPQTLIVDRDQGLTGGLACYRIEKLDLPGTGECVQRHGLIR